MMHTIAFEFGLGDSVRIREIDRPGIVLQLCVGDSGVRYLVAYWNDGIRKEEWLLAKEITDGNIRELRDAAGLVAGVVRLSP